MSNRIETPFTNEHFAEFVSRMVGQPYWYGTTGNRATDSLLKRKTAQYPSHYPASRTARYKKDILNKAVVCDCIGGCKAYAWSGGGENLLKNLLTGGSYSLKYGANGCPDKSANGMFSYAKQKGVQHGEIKTLPDVPGICLWKDGHVGYTIGGGMAVEWRSFSYGCVKTVISKRGFKNWFCLPFIDYGEMRAAVRSDIRRGMTGEDVKEMQSLLIKAGYPLIEYGADGEFGKETENALKNFQSENGLKADGIYGEGTKKALMDVLSEKEADTQFPVEGKTVVIRTNGGSVNIRLGNGTGYASVLRAENGERFPYVATAENGWHAVGTDAGVYWVSGEYGFLE